MIAVDNDQIVLADQHACVLHADRRRNAQTTGDDRGVGRATAQIGDETLERLCLELHHVGRRDVVRDDDHLVAGAMHASGQHAGRCTRQRLQHTLDNLLDVRFALTQIRVFDVVEMAGNTFELFCQRPFDVVAAGAIRSMVS